MSRPMDKHARTALVETYRGRRRKLAEAAHKYITFYEADPGYGIDWQRYTRHDTLRDVQSEFGELAKVVYCTCEEGLLAEMLWRMISNEEEAYVE